MMWHTRLSNAYLDRNIRKGVQSAVVDEECDARINQMANTSKTGDPVASFHLVPSEVWVYLSPDVEAA